MQNGSAGLALIEGDAAVRRRLQKAAARHHAILISAIAVFELCVGQDPEVVDAFLAGPLECVPLDDDDAREAGAIWRELQAVGTTATPHDVLLAGQARRRRATLVTGGARMFPRIRRLKHEDWAARAR